MLAHLQRLAQKFRRTDVSVTVHLAEADEFGVLQPGYHPQNTPLGAVFDVALEPDDVVSASHQILQPQLHTGVGLPPRTRIDEPDRLHRPEAQSVAPAPRYLFYRQTALEELLFILGHVAHALVRLDFLRRHQRVIKPVVLLLRHRTVDVVVASLAVARRPEDDVVIDRFAVDDRRNRVEEIKVALSCQSANRLDQRGRGERPGRDHRNVLGPVSVDYRNLLAP